MGFEARLGACWCLASWARGCSGLRASRSATTYTVNTATDSSDTPACVTTCSLRDALTAANTAGGTNTVVVPSGIYILTQGQLPQINNTNLTLTGAGARSTAINGNGASRIFDFTAGTIALSGVTVTDGFNDDTVGLPETTAARFTTRRPRSRSRMRP